MTHRPAWHTRPRGARSPGARVSLPAPACPPIRGGTHVRPRRQAPPARLRPRKRAGVPAEAESRGARHAQGAGPGRATRAPPAQGRGRRRADRAASGRPRYRRRRRRGPPPPPSPLTGSALFVDNSNKSHAPARSELTSPTTPTAPRPRFGGALAGIITASAPLTPWV